MPNTLDHCKTDNITTFPNDMSPFIKNGHSKPTIPLVASPDAPTLFNWNNEDENGYQITEQPMGTKRQMKIVILGAGASGINFLKLAQDQLEDVELVCLEKNPEVGGTWFENTYPGVACDIPSVSYQFTWEPYIWPEYYSSGAEIQKYLRGIVDKYGLMQYIRLQHAITGAEWREDVGKWHITATGPDGKLVEETCDVFVNGGGVLK